MEYHWKRLLKNKISIFFSWIFSYRIVEVLQDLHICVSLNQIFSSSTVEYRLELLEAQIHSEHVRLRDGVIQFACSLDLLRYLKELKNNLMKNGYLKSKIKNSMINVNLSFLGELNDTFPIFCSKNENRGK